MINVIVTGFINRIDDRQVGEQHCLSINVSSPAKKKVGENWETYYEYIRLKYWVKSEKLLNALKSAETITAFAHQVASTYEKDGEKVYATDWIVDTMEFHGTKRQNDTQRPF